MSQHLQHHNPNWTQRFSEASAELKRILGPDASVIHHIGSTSIPGILAKPILDILIVSPNLKQFAAKADLMIANGYEAKGAYGIVGRLYFRKHNPQRIRTHHAHVFEADSEQVKKHLVFRDYLRAHPKVALTYSTLKADITNNGKTEVPLDYQDRKAPFIEAVLKDAIEWYDQASKTD